MLIQLLIHRSSTRHKSSLNRVERTSSGEVTQRPGNPTGFAQCPRTLPPYSTPRFHYIYRTPAMQAPFDKRVNNRQSCDGSIVVRVCCAENVIHYFVGCEGLGSRETPVYIKVACLWWDVKHGCCTWRVYSVDCIAPSCEMKVAIWKCERHSTKTKMHQMLCLLDSARSRRSGGLKRGGYYSTDSKNKNSGLLTLVSFV